MLAACKKEKTESHNPGQPITIDKFIPEEGQGGTEMMIFGHNFSLDSTEVEVFINGVKAKITGINKERILLIVPEDAGTGNVEVSIKGNRAKSTTRFKFPPKYVWKVMTLAGSGTAGYANGVGTMARFNFEKAQGLDVDDEGNIYVADAGNHSIRKITPTGEVSTLAGNGSAGYVDGPAAEARFNTPFDVAIDNDKNIYVADTWNAKLRKITPDGVVSTITGVGNIVGIAIDKRNNSIYVSSLTGGAVYKVESNGNLSTVIEGLTWIGGIAIDAKGILYVVEIGRSVIQMLDLKSVSGSAGNPVVIAGIPNELGLVDGAGTKAKFDRPWGIAVDFTNNNLLVAGDSGPYGGTWNGGANSNQCIRLIKYDSWQVSTFTGNGERGNVNGTTSEARFNNPTGVAVDKSGNIYVVDAGNQCIRKIYKEVVND